MSKRTIAISAISALLVATGAAVAVHRAHGSQRSALWRLSNRGQRVTPSRGARRGLQIESARLLAVRDGRAFYELQTPAGRCFGVGSAASIGDPGGEACPTGPPFPSALRPVLDFSVYEGRPGDARTSLSVVRVEGFAADGVAAVAQNVVVELKQAAPVPRSRSSPACP